MSFDIMDISHASMYSEPDVDGGTVFVSLLGCVVHEVPVVWLFYRPQEKPEVSGQGLED